MTQSPDKMAAYIATARQQAQEEQKLLAQRCARARDVAIAGAELLKTKYGVKHMVLFGSLVHPELFHIHSDVDLAVWELPEQHYYRAVANLLDINPEFEVDLIRIEDAPATLQALVEEEGVEL
jgi:predicted nucleotidyltransferase